MTDEPNPTEKTTPAVAPRRRRWVRWIVRLGVLALVLLLLAPLALVLGPVKTMLTERISESLGYEVTADSAFAYWFHGVDLHDVTVHAPDGFDQPLATVEHIHVDVDVFALIRGRVDADILVERPHVTIERRGDISNLDPLLSDDGDASADDRGAERGTPSTSDRSTKAREPSDMRLSFVILGGVVEARGVPGGDVGNRIDDLELRLSLAPGERSVSLAMVARAAGLDGQDVRIDARVGQVDDGEGPVRLSIPPLALARISGLLESATGVRLLGGTLEVQAEGRLVGAGAADGTLSLDASEVHARLADGSEIKIGKANGSARINHGDAEGATGIVSLRLEPVSVVESESAGGRRFQEPRIAFDAAGRYDRDLSELHLTSGSLDAGTALTAKLTTPWAVSLDEPMRATGDARVDADLARLGSLRAIVPQLSRLRRGLLAANLRGLSTDRLGLSASVSVGGLVLDPMEAGGLPYEEQRVVLQARWLETGPESSRIDVYTLESDLITTTHTTATSPFVVFMTADGLRMDGAIGFRSKLEAVSRLLPGKLGLRPGERLGGSIEVDGHATGDEHKMEGSATVAGRSIRFPPRLAGRLRDASIVANVRAEMSGGVTNIVLSELAGLGLTGGGSARLASDAPFWVSDARAELGVVLADASPVVFAWLDTDPPLLLSGAMSTTLTARSAEGGLTVEGQTTITNAVWQAGPGAPVLREPRAALDHHVWLAPEGDRHRADRLVAVVSGLTATLSGSSIALGGDDPDLALRATLSGDAGRLAPTIAAFLGEDYADLLGEGPIEGSFSASGSPTAGGRDLLVDGSVDAGSWSTGGLDLRDARLTVRRDSFEHPLAAALTGQVNGGTADVGFELDVSAAPSPWKLSVRVKQVDTSNLLVDHGLGEYLAFAVPSLIPADSKVPVLSGRLDGTADLRADSTEDPLRSDTLRGTATIAMREGAIQDSSLFRAGGQDTLGGAGKALILLVPEAGEALARLSEAIAFSSLDSKLTIGERIVTVEETALIGQYVVIGTQGTVGFDERLDLDTRVQFQGKAGKRLEKYLPQGVIPLHVKGTLSDPKTRADVDVAKLAGGKLLDDLLGGGKKKDPLKRLKDLIGK